MTAGIAFAQDFPPISRIGTAAEFWGNCLNVSKNGDDYFAATGYYGLKHVRLEGDHFVPVASYHEFTVEKVVMAGELLHMVSGNQLMLVNPENPQDIVGWFNLQAGTQKTLHTAEAVFAYSYQMARHEPILWISLANPARPEVVAQIDDFTYLSGLTIDNNRLFVIEANTTLKVFDVRNPDDVIMLTQIELDSAGADIAVSGNLAVINHPRTFRNVNGYLDFYDISDIEHWELVGRFTPPEEEQGISKFKIYGDRLYWLKDYEPQFAVLNIEDPADPTMIWTSENIEPRVAELNIVDDQLIIPLGRGLITFDISNPDEPAFEAVDYSNGIPNKFTLYQDHGYLTFYLGQPEVPTGYGDFSLDCHVFDLTEEIPEKVGVIELGLPEDGERGVFEDNSGLDITLRGDLAVLAYDYFGSVHDISNPAEARMLSTLVVGDKAMHLRLLTLWSVNEDGVTTTNLANPRSPENRAHLNIDIEFNTFAFRGVNMIGLNGSQYSLFVNDPSDPSFIGTYGDERSSASVISGDYLYSCGRQGFYIWDVANLQEPQELSHLAFDGESIASSITVEGNLVALTSREQVSGYYENFLRIIDVSIPEYPRFVGSIHDRRHYRNHAVLNGPVAYVCEDNRLDVYDVSDVIEYIEAPYWQNYPQIQIANENDTIAFELKSLDSQNDELALTMIAEGLPQDVEFTDLGDGKARFFWLPNYNDAGIYEGRFVVSDGNRADTLTIPIRILNFNRPAEHFALRSPPNNSPLPNDSLVVFAWNSSADADDEELTYSFYLGNTRNNYISQVTHDTSLAIPRYILRGLFGWDRSLVWQVSVTDGNDTVLCDISFALLPPLGVEGEALAPSTFSLSAFPNPFNSSTTISFSVGALREAPLRLAIYDISGRMVAELLDGRGVSRNAPTSGQHKIVWNASEAGAGVYFVRLEAGGKVRTEKIILMR